MEPTRFPRSIAEDLREEDEEEEGEGDDGYRPHGCVRFGSYEVTADGVAADGVAVDRDPRGDTYGTVGRFFDEIGTTSGTADSLGAYPTRSADRLEGTAHPAPVVFEGRPIRQGPAERLPE
ncbi:MULTISPECIES: hypothetical protein [unclassified Streptomyces]|uniref:hypothetical protein n=1 Tax=unclassified Streptomyces TaxID=2593676 RepID=UPI00331A7315